MVILITGISGFSGKYLLTFLKKTQKGLNIIGLNRNIDETLGLDSMIACDLLDSNKLIRIISETSPEYIFHLAGLNFSERPEDFFKVNILGTINLLDAILKNSDKFSPRILIIGSAAEYGKANEGHLPINEKTPLQPHSFYAISKMAQDLVAYKYHLVYGLKIIRARPFNTIGPGQPNTLVGGKIIDEIYKVKKGLQAYVNLGDLESERDFTDIRDVVQAYWNLMINGKEGEVYNIGSGKATPIKHVLKLASKYANSHFTIKYVKQSNEKTAIKKSVADISKIKSHIGWLPSISLENSIHDMINCRFM